jgi:inhibitor of cysteine peptidase
VRQRIVVSGSLAAVIVSVAACSMFKSAPKPPPAPVTVSADQSGTSVALASGQDLVVRLPSNPSTGYRWIYVEPKDAVLRVDGPSSFEAQSAGTAGAGGTEIWKLAPFKPGQQQLRFEYRRPWEQDVAPSRIATYSVTVQ